MSLTAARRATLAALADSLLPHGGTLEPGASDVNVAGQLDVYLDRCAPGTRRTVNLMLEEDGIRTAVHDLPAACKEIWWGKRLAAVQVDLQRIGTTRLGELLAEAWESRAPARLLRNP